MNYRFTHRVARCSLTALLAWLWVVSAEATADEKKQIAAGWVGTPVMQAAYLKSAPVIDGKIDETEWEQATQVSGFINTSTKTYHQNQGEVYIGWNDTTFFIGYRGYFPAGQAALRNWDESALRSFVRERDGRVFDDDSVELYINPPDSPKPAVLIVNPLGTIFDRRTGEPEWNGDWHVASRVDDAAGVWDLEISIAFTELGVSAPNPGDTWNFNVVRTWRGLGQAFTSLTGEHAKEPGQLIFSRNGPVIRELTFGQPLAGAPKGSVEIVNPGSETVLVDTTYTLQNEKRLRMPEGSGRRHVKTAANGKSAFMVPGRIAGTGLYSLKINALDLGTGKIIHSRVVPFEVTESIQLSPFYVLSSKKLGVLANLMTVSSNPDLKISQTVFTVSEGGKVLAKEVVTSLPAKPFPVYFSGLNIDALTNEVEITCAVEAADKPVKQSVLYRIPPTPPWYGAYEPPEEVVPAPWTPVVVGEGVSVECWNRRHEFGSVPLPQQIYVGGVKLLAGPVRLAVETADGTLQWDSRPVKIDKTTNSKVVLSKSAAIAALGVQVVSSVEFDGFMDIKITLTPSKPVDLRCVRIEVPLPMEAAKFFHVGGKWGEKLYGAVTNRSQFAALAGERLYQWLGNDRMGLCWLTDSVADWQKSDKVRLGFNESDGRMIGYLQPWASSQQLDKPLTIRIGLQATPTRPEPVVPYKFSMAYNTPPEKSGADSAKNMDSVIGMSLAGKMNFPPYEKDYPMIKKWINGYHEKGLKFICYQYIDPGTETDDYKACWGDWVTTLPPDLKQWRTVTAKSCLNSSYSDFYCHTLDVMMGEFGADGMYLDGVEARDCDHSSLHGREGGCGQGVWPIFAAREHFKKLIYVADRHKGAEAVIVGHISMDNVSPLAGLFSMHYKGENYGAPLSYDDLTPDVMRAEFGRQWGPQPIALPQLTKKQAIPTGRFLGLFTLHGVQSAPSFLPADGRAALYEPLCKLFDEFPIRDAKFLPYFEQKLITEAAGRPVSLYAKNDARELLVVVANQTDKKTVFDLEFNLEGSKSISRMIEGISGRPQNFSGKKTAVELEPWGLKMLKVILVD